MCTNEELKEMILQQGEKLEKHTEDEMEVQKQVKGTLHDIRESMQTLRYKIDTFDNKIGAINGSLRQGNVAFQKLSLEDERQDQKVVELSTKISQMGNTVNNNADHIMKQGMAIEKLVIAVDKLGKALAPVIEVIHKISAAAPFFEMVGKATTWTVKHFAPIVGFFAVVWAYLLEPWKVLDK